MEKFLIYKDKLKFIIVKNDPYRYSVMKVTEYDFTPQGIAFGSSKWNNCEEAMLKDGFTDIHIKNIYKELLNKFSLDPSREIKLIQDGLPKYIKNKLIFI